MPECDRTEEHRLTDQEREWILSHAAWTTVRPEKIVAKFDRLITEADTAERELEEWKSKGHDSFQGLIQAGNNLRLEKEAREAAERKLDEAQKELEQAEKDTYGKPGMREANKRIRAALASLTDTEEARDDA